METEKITGAGNGIATMSDSMSIMTYEDGIFEFSSTENYDKTDSDAQETYDNVLRVECNSQIECFATINFNSKKMPPYDPNCIYKIRLVSKENSKGAIYSIDHQDRQAKSGWAYVFDITDEYKRCSTSGSQLTVNLYHSNSDTHVEFFTGGEHAPMLIIANKGVINGLLVECAVNLNLANQALAKHYYKTSELPDGVAYMTDLYTRDSIATICSIPAEKSLMNLNIQHVFRKGAISYYYGAGFKLNLDERIIYNEKYYYYDALGNKYWIKGNGVVVRDLIYTDFVPASVAELDAYKSMDDKNKPVKWIYSGNLVKGFDSDGYLVMISDSSKNYFKLVRARGNIIRLEKYHDDSCLGTMTFDYRGGYENLASISYNGEEKLTCEYTNGKLTKLNFLNEKSIEKSIEISYENNEISQIKSSDGYKSVIEKSDSTVKVTLKSTLTEIPDGSESDSLPEIRSDEIEFKDNLTVVNGEEYYAFNDAGLLTSYTKEENSVVVQAEQYNDIPGVKHEVVKCLSMSLNQKPYNSFAFVAGEKTVVTYNSFGQPRRVAVTDTPVKYGTMKDTVTTYNYPVDINKKVTLCSSEETEITYKTGFTQKKYKVITEHGYDLVTNLPRIKTTYVPGEENTLGKNVEEYEYDKYGNCKRIESYNSLDPAIRYITEKKFDEYGRLIEQKDPTGKYTTYYGYANYTNMLSAITYGNGSVDKYEYDSNGVNKVTFTDGGTAHMSNNINYTDGEIVSLKGGGNTIGFGYDSKRRMKKVTVNSTERQTFCYTDSDTVKERVITNAKNETFTLKNDEANGVLTYKYNNTLLCSVNYDKGGKVTKISDAVSGTTQNITYDSYDILTEVTTGGNKEKFEYNDCGALSKVTYSGAVSRTESYTYEDNPRMRHTKTDYGAFTLEPAYDLSGRSTGRKIKVNGNEVYCEKIKYAEGEVCIISTSEGEEKVDRATTIPSRIDYKDGSKIEYTYDSNGNITSITYGNGRKITYTYDKFGKLTGEEDVTAAATIKISYAYNAYGNMVAKRIWQTIGSETKMIEYTYYRYSNGRLKDGSLGTVTYDEIGNPVEYFGNTMTWTRGGMLTGYKNSTFTYDGLGKRTSKTVNGTTVSYTYDSENRLIKSSDGMEYYYDGSGVIAFKYNGMLYLYKKDIQGNINAILDSNGNVVVQYDYDAWGNHTVSGSNTALGELNPFRYRGYFYDADTGLYYLQTRYYDPCVGIFISPDSVRYADPEAATGLNLYAYCNNNPVMYTDPTGRFIMTTAMIVGLIIGAVIGATVGGCIAYEKASESGATGWELAGWTLAGVLGGGFVGGLLGMAAGWAAPTIGSFLGSSFTIAEFATAGGETVAVTITGGQAVAGVGALVANVLFARYKMPKHGEPNSTVNHGSYTGQYDENGNLISRKDRRGNGHPVPGYGKVVPHTHFYQWELINGIWEIVNKFVMPF